MKNTQQLIQTKDTSLNSMKNGRDLFGLFKSSSSLSKSIRQRQPESQYDYKTTASSGKAMSQVSLKTHDQSRHAFTLSASAKLVLNTMEKPSNTKEMTIRNLTHFYTKIDSNDETYNILQQLKDEKRANHLDALDDFLVWKENFFKSTDEKILRNLEKLKNQLESTKKEMNEQFQCPDDHLVTYVYSDIDKVESKYKETFIKRSNEIENVRNLTFNTENDRLSTTDNYISKLKKELTKIGFILDYEIETLIQEKLNILNEFSVGKKKFLEENFESIKVDEDSLILEADQNFVVFVQRWKDLRLNYFINETQQILRSSKFADPPERYKLIDELKSDQVKIYNSRLEIIEKVSVLGVEDLNVKNLENYLKNIEKIYNEAQNTYDSHTQRLVNNADIIYENSLKEIEIFREKVGTLRYNFDSESGLEELIKNQLEPILNEQKQERKDYLSKIIQYIEDYDEYVNNFTNMIINLMKEISSKNDSHKKNLNENEKKFLLSIAKEADEDENKLFEMEEKLKGHVEEIKNAIHKDIVEKSLKEVFELMDQMEKQYRSYFDIMEKFLGNHEGKIIDIFHSWEENVLTVFFILSCERLSEIQGKRQQEAEFLSKLKEFEILLEEAKDKTKKKSQPAKNVKKGEAPPLLVNPRGIDKYSSPLNFQYLIEKSLKEMCEYFVKSVLKNCKSEEKPKTPASVQVTTQGKEETKEEVKKGGKEVKRDNKKRDSVIELPQLPEELKLNPYEALQKKEFKSPISLINTKLLSEENVLDENYLEKIFKRLFDYILERIKEDMKGLIEISRVTDNERREEYLTELDMRLKSLAPRKGKIEVEVSDKRIMEIEKHQLKYEEHTKSVLERKKKDEIENNKIIQSIEKDYNELLGLFEKLNKGIDEEQSLKGLEDKYKKFKTSFYEFNLKIKENQEKLKQYSKTNPENILYTNQNLILGFQTFDKGGTYSHIEIEYYKKMMGEIDDIIKKFSEDITQSNQAKIDFTNNNVKGLLDKFDLKYNSQKELIQAKDGVGKKYGAPKRLANDVVINVRLKANQAQEGLDRLLEELRKLINQHQFSKSDQNYLKTNSLPLEIRKQLLTINSCVFNYGKYIEAFKTSFIYSEKRVNIKDTIETIELTLKDEIEEDALRKINELSNLGYLSKSINSTFLSEINEIESKVKAECSKIYTGPMASIINNPDKIPLSLIPFLSNLKNEMDKFRLKCIRDLRTYSQNLFKLSTDIGEILYDFLFLHAVYLSNENKSNLDSGIRVILESSDRLKSKLTQLLGPHLSNPYYANDLKAIIEEEKQREDTIFKAIDTYQYDLIISEEKLSNSFFIRINNNFEAFLALFDSIILEEDYVLLGDEEYFKERKDYNFLLKLKQHAKPGLDLNSKRSFKKIYPGIDKSKIKGNFVEKYLPILQPYLNNDEEKNKALTEIYKENLSKSITGLKTPNNKSLFLTRKKIYEHYISEFSNKISKYINENDELRKKEQLYKKSWDTSINSLKI